MAVGSFLMDEEPMRFEWNDVGIQWKGKVYIHSSNSIAFGTCSVVVRLSKAICKRHLCFDNSSKQESRNYFLLANF